jgi:hypothetical protein
LVLSIRAGQFLPELIDVARLVIGRWWWQRLREVVTSFRLSVLRFGRFWRREVIWHVSLRVPKFRMQSLIRGIDPGLTPRASLPGSPSRRFPR